MTVRYDAFDHFAKIPSRWLVLGVLALLAPAPLYLASIFTGGVVHACVIGLLYITFQEYAEKGQFKQFLTDNRWYPEADKIANYVATPLLGIGYYQDIVDGFAGFYNDFPMHAVLYHYKTQGGHWEKNRTFISVCIDLNLLLPLVVLDSTRNDYLTHSNLPERIPGSRILQLEGNFSKHYKVIVIPGTERTVLQFLTPDFMDELLAAPPKVDIHFEADRLFLIMHDETFTKPVLQQMFDTAEIVTKHLKQVKIAWQASASPQAMQELATEALRPRAEILSRPPRVR